jgi:uncharacterized protein YjiS (DUF1127 family)
MLPKRRSSPLPSLVAYQPAPSRELRFDLRDNSSATHEKMAQTSQLDLSEVKSPVAVMPAMTRADRQNSASWSSMFTFFMEGFALYGASYGSYGTLLQAAARSPRESSPTDARAPQPEEIFWRERRRFIAIVASNPEVTGSEKNDVNRIGRGSGAPSENTGPAGFYGSPSFDADRSNHRNWWTKAWAAVASRWARWHRERELKKAVAALAEFDDRTLRDMGIPHRSEIEQVVRYGRDC